MPELMLILQIAWISLAVLLVTGAAVVLLRTRRMQPRQTPAPPEPKSDAKVANRAAEHLAEALRFQTVSHPNPEENAGSEWVRLRDSLKKNYPLVHERLERVVVSKYSLLYRWVSPQACGDPLLFCGHLDVVPASGQWSHPPFAGEIVDDVLWGRGTIDCKHLVVGLLECVESLLEEGFTPSRDIWFAFGHDEEVGGPEGASAIAKLFAEREMRFAMVLDEGGFIKKEFLSLPHPTALVAVSEKGFLNVRLKAEGEAGHASTPPSHTALGILSKAICRIEYKGRRPRLTPLVRDMLLALGPEFSFGRRLALSNLWLFRGRILQWLLREPGTAALVRTTMAVTMGKSGTAANVLPSSAEAVVNIRLLHGESSDTVIRYLQDLVGDLGVTVEPERVQEASQLSDYKGELFSTLTQSIQEIFGPVPVVPYLMCGGTDAHKYETFSAHVYRFCPFVLTEDEHKRMHNTDEHVRVDALGSAVLFYRDLFRRLAGGDIKMEEESV